MGAKMRQMTNPDDTPKTLKEAITHVRYQGLKTGFEDHEKRLRDIEGIVIEVKFIKSLVLGGGLLSLIQLMSIVILIGMQVYGK